MTESAAKRIIQVGMGEMFNENFPVLSFNGFMSIISSEKNEGYDPMKLAFSPKDMHYPLDQYYIATSDGPSNSPRQQHPLRRTVSSGDSLGYDGSGVARKNAFVLAIQQGCRCLELNCYEKEDADGKSELYVGSAANKENPNKLIFRGISY